jgi:hypothetical protein
MEYVVRLRYTNSMLMGSVIISTMLIIFVLTICKVNEYHNPLDPQTSNEHFWNSSYCKLEYVLSRLLTKGCVYFGDNLCKIPYTTKFSGVYNSYTSQLTIDINLVQNVSCVNEETQESCSIILSQANWHSFSGSTMPVSSEGIGFSSRPVRANSLLTANSWQR